jgi:hypothetical protein
MFSMPQEYPNSVMSERREDAENYRRCRRLLAARRWQRKAELTSRRARLAQTAVW